MTFECLRYMTGEVNADECILLDPYAGIPAFAGMTVLVSCRKHQYSA